MPSAKTQDDVSLKELRLRRFEESALPRTLMASASTASIRRCSLEKVCAPTDSKNWLGRSTSGSGFSRPSSKASFLESFCIASLDLVVFRHILRSTPLRHPFPPAPQLFLPYRSCPKPQPLQFHLPFLI